MQGLLGALKVGNQCVVRGQLQIGMNAEQRAEGPLRVTVNGQRSIAMQRKILSKMGGGSGLRDTALEIHDAEHHARLAGRTPAHAPHLFANRDRVSQGELVRAARLGFTAQPVTDTSNRLLHSGVTDIQQLPNLAETDEAGFAGILFHGMREILHAGHDQLGVFAEPDQLLSVELMGVCESLIHVLDPCHLREGGSPCGVSIFGLVCLPNGNCQAQRQQKTCGRDSQTRVGLLP